MKKSSDTIGNRTRDLKAYSAVPQPTAPQRAPIYTSSVPNMRSLRRPKRSTRKFSAWKKKKKKKKKKNKKKKKKRT
jgi:hypothetical protein